MPDASDASTVPSCDRAAAWAQMFKGQIVPPLQMLGLNLSGPDDAGITISQIAPAACQVFDGGDLPEGMWNVYWGDASASLPGTANLYYDQASGRYSTVRRGRLHGRPRLSGPRRGIEVPHGPHWTDHQGRQLLPA
jgi:hypothetical protein